MTVFLFPGFSMFKLMEYVCANLGEFYASPQI